MEVLSEASTHQGFVVRCLKATRHDDGDRVAPPFGCRSGGCGFESRRPRYKYKSRKKLRLLLFSHFRLPSAILKNPQNSSLQRPTTDILAIPLRVALHGRGVR